MRMIFQKLFVHSTTNCKARVRAGDNARPGDKKWNVHLCLKAKHDMYPYMAEICSIYSVE